MELVRTKIGVPRERLRVVEFGVVVRVDGVDVTFLRANHCPGAAMICFEFPHRRDASPVLHTGDFRFHDGMRNDPTLLRITSDPSAPRPILILDTTYCSLEHDDFPTQERVLKAVRDAVVHEDLLSTRKLFLFGTYTIGKEKVFLEAAKVESQGVHRKGEAKRHGRHSARSRGEKRHDARRLENKLARRSDGLDEFHEDGVHFEVL